MNEYLSRYYLYIYYKQYIIKSSQNYLESSNHYKKVSEYLGGTKSITCNALVKHCNNTNIISCLNPNNGGGGGGQGSQGSQGYQGFQGNSGTINGSVSTSLIPTTDVLYDLGSSEFRFRSVYLSGSTIYLGDATISANAEGNVTVTNSSGQTTDLGSTGPTGALGPQGQNGIATLTGATGTVSYTHLTLPTIYSV